MLVSLLAVSVLSGAAELEKADPNPDFTAYLQQAKIGITGLELETEGRSLGHIPGPVDLSHTAGKRVTDRRRLTALPSSYDLRGQGRLTPVKDQGDCGACWSFATYSSLESWMLTNGEGSWDFSEKNMIECHGYDWGPCYGGNLFISAAYLARRSGPVSEADDPYVDYETGCTAGLPVQKYVENVYMPPSVGGPEENAALKQAVMDFGAIYTSMYWSDVYYNSSDYTYYYSGSNPTDHAIAIVGWDDDMTVPGAPGPGAWIARNSWGTSFGENGYFYISYYDSQVGRYNAAFIHAEAPDDTALYQYDPLGWTGDWGFGTTTAWGKNVFTADSGGQLTSVSTYATDVNTSYEIYVSNEDSGGLVQKKTGTFNYPGYHTVDLSSPTSLEPGETFTVAIRYQTSGYNYPLPAECSISGYSSAATAGPGESFVSTDGSSWSDLTTLEDASTCNINIKAIVTTSGPAAPSNLTATAASDTEIDLTWQDNSTDETEFRIYRDGTQIDTVGSNVTSYQDDGLSEDTEYCYRVSAYNGNGESAMSNQSCATTSGGTALTKYYSCCNWYLMSIPSLPDPNTCSSVLGDDLPSGYSCDQLVWGPWDGSAYGHPETVSPFKGYWLFVPSSTTLDVSGEVPTDREVALNHTGWHMIGTPVAIDWGDVQIKESGESSYSNVSDVDFTSSGAPLANAIFEYDPGINQYVAGYQPGWDTFTLDRWTGYWVLVEEDATLPVYLKFRESTAPPPPPPSSTSTTQGIPLDNLNQDLPAPPPPPTGDVGTADLSVAVSTSFVQANQEVTFSLAGSGSSSIAGLRVEVTDLTGQTLFKEETAGNSLTWDTEEVPNGVYLYRAKVNDGSGFRDLEIGKVLVLR